MIFFTFSQYAKPDDLIRDEIEWEKNVLAQLKNGFGGMGGGGGDKPPDCKTS